MKKPLSLAMLMFLGMATTLPAVELVNLTNIWRYNQSGSNLGTNWRAANFDDSAWPSGTALLYNETAALPVPKNTLLSLTNLNGAIITYYFRTHFTLPFPGAAVATLFSSNLLDDGAVFYINGAEAGRTNLPPGPITFTNLASTTVIDATSFFVLELSRSNLVAGDNVLAVEVHQSSTNSSDVVFGLALQAEPAPVTNDHFANRFALSGTNLSTSGFNVNATKEPGEPNHAGNSGGASVWWTWTAPTNRTVVVDTIGSSFDTTLAVYVGTSIASLTLVASDNQSGGDNTSRVTFPGVAGTIYQIAVDGFGGASGSIVLNLAGAPLLPSGAPIPGLFNTGVDANGAPLASGSVDPHWLLMQSADTNFPGPNAIVVNDAGFPIPPWLTNGPNSKWLAPQANQTVGNAAGDYKYRLTFDLTGLKPSTAIIIGSWTSDNLGPEVLLNGVSTGFSSDGNFPALGNTFTITNGFIEGMNTLDFVINNAGTNVNPTGFRAELSGTANLGPGPASQIITFGILPTKTVGDLPFTLNAVASSGLAVNYSNSNPAVVSLSGNLVTILGVGTAVITANQPGNANYLPASPVSQMLTVKRATAAYTWITIAGSARSGSADGVSTTARFNAPFGVSVDASGDAFVADTGNNTIRQITSAGVVSTIAGFPRNAGSMADGIGSSARFDSPLATVIDGNGDIYVADRDNNVIRRITRAGTNWVTSTVNQLGASPSGIVGDAAGNLYLTYTNHTIHKATRVGTNWQLSTISGVAGIAGSADGTNTAPRFNSPSGIAVDVSGNLFVADTGNHTIRKIAPMGPNWVVTTIAGLAGSPGMVNGANSAARFSTPFGVAVDNGSNLYVTDNGSNTIRKISAVGNNWIVSTLAGVINPGSADGTGTNASFFGPKGIALDPLGNLVVADTGNHEVRYVTSAGVVNTLAGNPTIGPGSVDGIGMAARFDAPLGIAVQSGGNIYIADTDNHTIRKITTAGVVTTIAGLAGNSGSVDGVGSFARFLLPTGLTVDSSGNVFVAEYYNNTIRKITPAGVVSTIAGSATSPPGSNDGTNSAARFDRPSDIAVDSSGNLFVADDGNYIIRRIRPVGTNWVVNTIAGSAGMFGGTDGTNNSARFRGATGITIDSLGNLWVSDSFDIRKITPSGTNWVVRTLVFLADFETLGRRIAVDGAGILYTTDLNRDLIHKITPLFPFSIEETIARGTGSQDGLGFDAGFFEPFGIATDAAGNLYVADSGNNTIRKGVFNTYGSTNLVPYVQPPMNGQLRVTLFPTNANGQWRFPWELGWRNGGAVASNLVAGNYPVEFRSLPGWLAIPSRVIVAVTNNGTVPLTNLYYPTISSVDTNVGGALTVNIGPSPPVGVGWRFLGDLTSYFSPGYTTNLLPGIYLIEFAPVDDYSKPPNYAVQVSAGLPTVLSVTYLLASLPPAGVLLPFPVPTNQLSDINNYPFGFNGQLQSDIGYGSGVAVQDNVVLTVAHQVFNDQNLSFVSRAYWYFRQEKGLFEPQPLEARGWYLLSGYAARRTNDVLGGLGPDQSSPQSRNMDVAALYFLAPVAGGGYGGYLPSDTVPNPWLTGTSLKMLVGYPVDGSLFGDANIVAGRMYQTDPQPYPLSLATDPVADQQVHVAPWFLSYPGNSGGPVYAQFNGYFYPAGVYLGTLFNGVQPYASAVRAIDSSVVNLIAMAAAQGDSGTNNTGGGVITIIPSQGINANNPGYVQFRLTPPAAVRAGAGWRLLNDAAYSSATNYTRAVTSTNAFAVEFKSILGWSLPTNQLVTVFPGQITTNAAFYSVSNPLMVINRTVGIGITGTTGTTYRIERRSSLASGTWLPVSTNTIMSTGFNLVFPNPPTNPPTTFYRLQWLP